jgi:C-terminal processing protease CtpA/Prc
MLRLMTIESTTPTPYVENYYVAFDSYKRHKGDIQSKAEKNKVVWNKGDVLVAVNGEDIAGKTLSEVKERIKGLTDDTITLTFLRMTWFNDSGQKSVRKG